MNSEAAIQLLQSEIANGNQHAYRQLFTLLYPKLYRFVFSLTKNRELSEEIVSDVFINIWRKKENLPEVVNLKLYLYTSAKNISINYLSKLAREKTVNLDDLDPLISAPFINAEEALITKEMDMRIRNAIQALPPKAKLIFILIKENGFSYREAAEILNLSVSTVDNQLVIAIKKIAKTLHYRFVKK